MSPVITRRELGWALSVSALIVALASLPYLVGWVVTPAGYHFTGLLINPIDGHSYLAKMGQGAAGSWLFRLPYAIESHQPVFIFTYHLALGHLAPGGSPVTLVWVYHLARVFFGFVLLMAVYWAAAFFTGEIRQRRLVLLLVGLASGLGWLVGSGPDLTVPEAVTFPSLLVNAHFGLTALLMLLLILGITLASHVWQWWVVVAVASAGLTMIQPFAVLVVGVAAGGWLVVQGGHRGPPLGLSRSRKSHHGDTENTEFIQGFPILSLCSPRLRGKKTDFGNALVPPLQRLALFILCSLPFLLYDVWMTRNNPIIGQWMAQNVTPSPPAWQWLTAYGLLWPLAAAGAWRAARRRTPADWLLLTWAAGQLALMLLPIPLQRRLSTGLHLPLCFLAAMGFREVVVPRLSVQRQKLLTAGLLLVVLPSNLLLMAAGVSGVLARNPYLVLADGQWEAMEWLRENISPETVVLADEELGTAVPAWGGGARVVYGHPFETLDADVTRAEVNDFYTGRMSAGEWAAFLDRFGVEIIIVQTGRYEMLAPPLGFYPAWQSDSVIIYQALSISLQGTPRPAAKSGRAVRLEQEAGLLSALDFAEES